MNPNRPTDPGGLEFTAIDIPPESRMAEARILLGLWVRDPLSQYWSTARDILFSRMFLSIHRLGW